MDKQPNIEFRIMPSGDGRWYWELIKNIHNLITRGVARHVVKRGVARTEPQACQQASNAAQEAGLMK